MEVTRAIQQIRIGYERAMLRIPLLAGNEVVNFTLNNFRMQGFMGNTFQRWLPVKKGWRKKSGGSILIGTGRLRRSIRITQLSATHVAVGTDVKYARAHNEGLRLGIIQTVKGFTRRNGSNVSSHTRRINQSIPARPYLKDSPYLRARVKRVALAEFIREIPMLRG